MPWDRYFARTKRGGDSVREILINREKEKLSRKMEKLPSCHTITINGDSQNVVILDQKDFNFKKICAMPNEALPHGAIVDWAEHKWLITELDANDTIYRKGKMRRCNYLLKWLSNGEIIERWCVIGDSSQGSDGEASGKIMTVGDSQTYLLIGKDECTAQLKRGQRFLIGDEFSDSVLAYEITKPDRLFGVYKGEGVLRFILKECNLADDDNLEEMVANYTISEKNNDSDVDSKRDKGVWL